MGTQSLPLAQFEAHEPQNFFFQLLGDAAGVTAGNGKVQHGPDFRVPPGAAVTLRPTNGVQVNAQPVNVSQYPEQVFSLASLILPFGADVSIPYPVENLNQIWAKIAPGDGLLITVTEPEMG